MKTPRVSVIVSAYNHARYIEQALDSVFDQTFSDWELIVLDDGSSDDTHAVLEAYRRRRDDPRLRVYLNRDNAGQARRFNQAIGLARGELVTLLPSDDWYLPNKLEVQVRAFDGLGPEWGVVYGNGYRYFEDTGQTIPVRVADPIDDYIIPRMFFDPGIIYPIVPMVRRECFLRFPFWEEFRVDGEAVYFRIGMGYKFKYVDEFVATMRAHSYNSGGNIALLHRDVPEILRRVFDHPELPADLRPLRATVLSKYVRRFAWNAIRQHSNREIWQRCLRDAFEVSPRRALSDVRSYLGVVLAALPEQPRRALNGVLTDVGQRVYRFRVQRQESRSGHVATG